MRLVALLVLAFGSSALCQSGAPAHANPDNLFQLPQKYSQAGRDVTKFPSGLDPASIPLPQIVIAEPGKLPENLKIDPGIILRPPTGHNRDAGQPIAQNLYPGLRMVPIR
jgi:hypothetical protein